MSFLREQNKTGLAIALCIIALLVIGTVQFYAGWTARMGPPPVGKDYPAIYWQDLMKDPIGVLFYLQTGSSPFLRYYLLGLLWIWSAYLAGRLWPRHKHITDKLFWSSFWWCICATIIIWLAWSFGAIVQYNFWYGCPTPGYCSPQPQGMMDKYTHALTGAALLAMLATVNFKDTLGLKGRTGRLIELGILVAALFFLPIYWEYAELGDPTRYASTYIDAVTDMFAGIGGGSLTILTYNGVVPYEE